MISVVLLVVLLGGYWMLLLSPKRSASADAEQKVAAAQTVLQNAQSQLTSGQRAAETFRRDRAKIVRLGRVVPATDDAATVLVQLQAIAKREGVVFSSYGVESAVGGSSAPVVGEADPVVTDPDAGKSTSAVAPLYPPGSVEMAGGLGRTSIKVELLAPYFKIERFLRAVQRFAVISSNTSRRTDGRLFIVDGINYTHPDLTEIKDKNSLKAEVYASVYFAPAITAPAAPTADGTTAATAPGAASTTSTPPASIGTLR